MTSDEHSSGSSSRRRMLDKNWNKHTRIYVTTLAVYLYLHNPTVGPDQFRWNLKTHLFTLLVFHWAVFTYSRYISVHLLTYLLTYYIVIWLDI